MENQNVITKRKNKCQAGEDNRCSLAVWSWKGHLCFWVPEIQLQNTELILFTDVLTLNQQSQNISNSKSLFPSSCILHLATQLAIL